MGEREGYITNIAKMKATRSNNHEGWATQMDGEQAMDGTNEKEGWDNETMPPARGSGTYVWRSAPPCAQAHM
eukprot:9311980-Pyramimonas_sp.AAC.1